MKKTIIPLVLGFVGDTVVALVCEAFVGVVTKMILKMFSQLVLTMSLLIIATSYKEFHNYSAERRNDLNQFVTQCFKKDH